MNEGGLLLVNMYLHLLIAIGRQNRETHDAEVANKRHFPNGEGWESELLEVGRNSSEALKENAFGLRKSAANNEVGGAGLGSLPLMLLKVSTPAAVLLMKGIGGRISASSSSISSGSSSVSSSSSLNCWGFTRKWAFLRKNGDFGHGLGLKWEISSNSSKMSFRDSPILLTVTNSLQERVSYTF